MTVPALLQVDADRGWTTWSALPGASLHELARAHASPGAGEPGYVEAAGLAGQALRALHAVAASGLPVHGPREEADVVTQWLTRAAPYLASRWAVPETLVNQVRTAAPRVAARTSSSTVTSTTRTS